MTAPDEILMEAYAFAGQPYEFGAEVPHSLDPDGVCPVDCSELVEAACRRAGVSIPDGAYNQWITCEGIPVGQAFETRGALLFYGDGTGSGRDAITHVAFSEGDGTTWEAWKDGLPVGSYPVDGRPWTFAGLIPGVDYSAKPHAKRREEGMLVLHPSNRVYLLTGGKLVLIHDPDFLPGLEKIWGKPERVDSATWNSMVAAYGEPC